ncbi:MAG TPA: class I SAM-dependent methyltransferase [Candidatus Omnitrophota bacterium]|nr:class I SAM-dependent methyltransferase [Candidatus Omnitrophota bacterium]HPS36674.1 class I SAM-dependent methyltransferase [Candidatus Omnitrophota bacterium]
MKRLEVKKENWDKFWSSEASGRYTRISWSKRRILAVLDPFLREGMEVLDAGCGSGFFSQYFLSKSCRVWSLDHSEASLEITRKNTGGKCQAYLKEDLLNEKWTAAFRNKFDLVFTDGLFEHFLPEDQRALLDRFKSVKKENGILATFVPNRDSWWQIVRPLAMPGIREVPFTASGLRALHSGMKILKTGGLSVLPFRFSPEKILSPKFGMILYLLAV